MSWGEVSKINNNFKLTLNEQARQLAYAGSYLFTSSVTFTPEKSGWYKIIAVGKGGKASTQSQGASAGVAISTRYLDSSLSYSIIVTSENSKFANEIIATSASGSVAGTASGGDFNFQGLTGSSTSGADLGVAIAGLMQTTQAIYLDSGDMKIYYAESGNGILGYGGGQTRAYSNLNAYSKMKSTGCILIIPLELEE